MENTPEVSKKKKFILSILVILVIWIIARGIPGIVKIYSSNLALLAAILTLPIGWLASCAISKRRVPSCINANLYAFLIIEALGLLQSVLYVSWNLSGSTGRYSTDINGIAYSDYPLLLGKQILFGAVYIVLCVYLTKKTPRPAGAGQETET